MKRRFLGALSSLGLLAALPAGAWTYQDGDVLLIFRENGFNDVEFNLGNVSQFLNKPNGYTVAVTNWSKSLVTDVFGPDLSGVSVVLAATTSWTNSNRTAWLSGTEPNTTAYNVTPSTWQSALWSTINSVGTRPLTYLVPTAGLAAYSIDPNGTYRLASYDQIVSANGVNLSAIASFGGHAPFVVEQIVPGTFSFWAIQPSTAIPKPPDTLVGSFTISADGTLTFTAGPPPATVTGVSYADNVSAVTFDTRIGGNYWLTYTNSLDGAGAQSTWARVAGPIAGTGNPLTLTHTNAESNGFYGVVRTP